MNKMYMINFYKDFGDPYKTIYLDKIAEGDAEVFDKESKYWNIFVFRDTCYHIVGYA